MLLVLLQLCRNIFRAPRHLGKPSRTCLTFQIFGVLFGIDTDHIKNIVRCGVLAVPRDKPSFLRGFHRQQRQVLPVLDLSRRYSEHATHIGARSCIVAVELVCGGHRQEIGVLAEEVSGMATVGARDFKRLPEFLERRLDMNVIEGVVKVANELMIVLDIQGLLTHDEFWELVKYMTQFQANMGGRRWPES